VPRSRQKCLYQAADPMLLPQPQAVLLLPAPLPGQQAAALPL
jgi:hypothetical protein